MWREYDVELQIEGPFGASIPHTQKDIEAVLTHRMPKKKPDEPEWTAENLDEVVASVSEARNLEQEEPETGWLPGWAGFLRDEEGIYYETRCIRGHLKDAAFGIREMVELKNFRSKFVSRIYIARVNQDKVFLMRDNKRVCEPDGTIERFIQVMTRQGPRSSIKYVDFVNDPLIPFRLKVLDDGVITQEHVEMALEYGGTHGIGAERSQGWGNYTVKSIKEAV